MPLDIDIVAPERQTREVVKVIRMLRGDGIFRPPADPDTENAYNVHHYYDHYSGGHGGWDWTMPGDRPRYQAEWEYWPYVFFFSDGTFGMCTAEHIQEAFTTLGVAGPC